MRLVFSSICLCLLLSLFRSSPAAPQERPGNSLPARVAPALTTVPSVALENLEPQSPLTANLPTGPAGKIVVQIKNLRNDKGLVRVNLFATAKGFPNDYKVAFKTVSGKIVNQTADITLSGIPHGTYAIGIMHDEDSNGKMKANWLGMPQEGVGASNDAKGSFGPPKFEDATFQLDADSLTLTIALIYL